VQWRDVIVTMTSVGQQQIIHCLWRHQLQRWQRDSNSKLQLYNI